MPPPPGPGDTGSLHARAAQHCQVIIIVQCCRYRQAAATDTDRQSVLSVLSVYYLRRPWAQSLVLTTGVSDRTMRRRPAFSCAVRHGSRSRGGPGHAASGGTRGKSMNCSTDPRSYTVLGVWCACVRMCIHHIHSILITHFMTCGPSIGQLLRHAGLTADY